MENPQSQFQTLGLAGILTTSATVISSSAPNRRHFSRLAATLLLPFSLLFLLQTLVSRLLDLLPDTNGGPFLLFQRASFLALLLLSLLPTSAVAVSVASLLTSPGKDLAFSPNLVLSLLRRIRKRALLTLLAGLVFLAGVYLLLQLSGFTIACFLGRRPTTLTTLSLYVVAFFFLKGVVDVGATWLMATVASVLEDVSGMSAMRESRELIKARSGTATAVFLAMVVTLFWVDNVVWMEVCVGDGRAGVGFGREGRVGVSDVGFADSG